MDKQEIYKIAVNTRQLEIQLFWQRSNYFMVLNTAIAVGFFSLQKVSYAPVLALLGAAVSFLWFFINLGGKYWQSRWEEAAARLERECCPEAKLFSASPEFIKEEVTRSLSVNQHKGFQKWLDTRILKKTVSQLSNDCAFVLLPSFLVRGPLYFCPCEIIHTAQQGAQADSLRQRFALTSLAA